MNILFCIESLGRGGAENVLLALASELVRNKHKVHVAVIKEPYDLKANFERNGIKVLKLRQRYKWNLISRSKDLSILASKYSADVVHGHLYFPSILTALMKILWLRTAVTVITFHNLAYEDGVNKQGAGLKLRKFLGKLFYPPGVNKFLAVSFAVAEHYQKHLALTSVQILHNAIDLSIIPTQPNPASSASENLCIVVPGRLVEEKGHTYFIEALEKLVSKGSNYRVIFAGGGPLELQLMDHLTQTNLKTVTEVTGTLTHDDMLATMALADIVVIPSVHEGFGLVALEAMALGKPVLATRVGGLPEIITDEVDGVLVDSKNVDELVFNINRLAADVDLRKSLAANARKCVEARFSIVSATLKLQAIYLSLLDKPL